VDRDVGGDEIHDVDGAPIRHDDGSLSIDGEMTLAEIRDDYGITISNPDVTTIAGLVLAAHGTLPTVGTTVTPHAHDLTVEEMHRRKTMMSAASRSTPTATGSVSKTTVVTGTRAASSWVAW
jgi:CBS domain containing-hemolysin-like protein